MDDGSIIVIAILLVGIVVLVIDANTEKEPRPIDLFCEDYFIRGTGFAGYHYYCPIGDTVKEFTCGKNNCYWLSNSGESDE